MKTKTANCVDTDRITTCTCYGEKDLFGKAIWRDSDGKAYELKHARLSNQYFFCRYSSYDKILEDSF